MGRTCAVAGNLARGDNPAVERPGEPGGRHAEGDRAPSTKATKLIRPVRAFRRVLDRSKEVCAHGSSHRLLHHLLRMQVVDIPHGVLPPFSGRCYLPDLAGVIVANRVPRIDSEAERCNIEGQQAAYECEEHEHDFHFRPP